MIKKYLPYIFSIIGFIIYQLVVISIGFSGLYRSVGAGCVLVITYYIGHLVAKKI
jgi:hypothetical protein